MKIIINEKCDCDEMCDTINYFIFKTKWFQIRFFNDYGGYKFLYIHIGDKIWQWDW